MGEQDRQGAILQYLQRRGTAQVTELAVQLGVSEVTIRRHLSELERQGAVARYHGGAILPNRLVTAMPFAERQQTYTDEKHRIAAAAAGMVEQGMTVALGAGTTVAAVAGELRDRRDLTVVTNAVNVAWEFASHDAGGPRLMVTGGHVREASFALVGPAVEHTMRDLFVDIAILGATGLTPDHGFTTPNPEEALSHRALTSRARRVVMVVTNAVWGRVAFAQIVPVHRVQTIITDAQAPADMLEQVAQMGVEVIVT